MPSHMSRDELGTPVTDEKDYLNRRTFLRAAALVGSVSATALIYRAFAPRRGSVALTPKLSQIVPATTQSGDVAAAFKTDEPQTPMELATTYNNFYEFSTGKEQVAPAAADFVTRPWTVQVGGLCAKPRTFDIDDLLKLSPAEERIYRMRCVEAWSMVIPWAGLPLSKVLEAVEPLSSAQYVAFETLHDPKRMPGQNSRILNWPYREGLRMDEAMHPLTILASGMYGRQMPPQNGAPLRLVVPWKYGFKGIKSIVKITLVEEQPPTSWSLYATEEYGFYANVNPEVDHPRWSQATEQRIGGGFDRRDTLPFNGYADQVAHLYSGMDLAQNF